MLATAGWALSATAWGVGLLTGLLLLSAGTMAWLSGNETPILSAVGTALYLMPFALVITLVLALPVTLMLLGVWVTLAHRGVIDDGSRGGLGVSAAITSLISALVFMWTSGGGDEPFALSTIVTAVAVASVVCAALLLPRCTVLGLEPGRFGPHG